MISVKDQNEKELLKKTGLNLYEKSTFELKEKRRDNNEFMNKPFIRVFINIKQERKKNEKEFTVFR